MTDDKPAKTVLQPVDEAVRREARTLLREARSAALATLDPGSGAPAASRALLCVDPDGAPVVFLSALSPHTAAMTADPRVSLLIGEPGRGDPLAYARLTVSGRALKVSDAEADRRAKARCLARHPKAKLYIDLPDFAFWRIEPDQGSYVAGFGRAHTLSRSDLVTQNLADAALAAAEHGAVEHMNDDHADAIELYATAHLTEKPGHWALARIDATGLDLRLENRLRRLWFDTPLATAEDMRARLVILAKAARRTDH